MRFELRDGVLHTDGVPGLLATADYPYYRDDPTVWQDRLRTLRDATGIGIVSSYIPWRHHQPDPDTPPDFTGATRADRDVLGYLRICAELGLRVILKPGPFIHAETNYGGLPDWICPLRDPRVEAQLDAHGEPVRWVGSVAGPDGRIERWPLPAPLGGHFAARTAEWLGPSARRCWSPPPVRTGRWCWSRSPTRVCSPTARCRCGPTTTAPPVWISSVTGCAAATGAWRPTTGSTAPHTATGHRSSRRVSGTPPAPAMCRMSAGNSATPTGASTSRTCWPRRTTPGPRRWPRRSR
ncbi:hypothetical protein GXW82_05640 [Streptacidiphilus sp. 4-A2]|nr:hypothetical protein [Streptacidiphilus sp. 4-A2]